MKKFNVDYLLLGPSANMYYLTGLKAHSDERLQLLILGLEGNFKLILPEMYKKQVQNKEIEGDIYFWRDEENPATIIRNILKGTQEKKFAIDDSLWFLHIYNLKNMFDINNTIPASKIMRMVRMFKENNEINYLKKAGLITSKVLEEIKDIIDPGLSEKTIGIELEIKLKKYSDGLSFKPLVGGGKNGALGHHKPGNYKLTKGDFVLLDFGCKINEYCSDITRTFAVGNPSKEMKKVYGIVKLAQQKAFDFIKPGIKCSDVDNIAREFISKAGYGDFFTHRTGHGVGLDIHEEPYIAGDNDTELVEGMVFTIEPGIYIPDHFGVRIEDSVLVTKNGAERLNTSPHDLQIL